MFADELERFGDAPAIIAEGGASLSYRELAGRADAFAERLGPERSPLLIEARNELPAIVAYLGALRARHPAMLVPAGRDATTRRLRERYRPGAVWQPDGASWALRRAPERVTVHPDLAVLLSTSGSTGSEKFVRLSARNVEANARAICEYLRLDAGHVGITSLPIFYSYGLSVVNSHLACGGALVLTDASVVEERFWRAVRAHRVTGFAGVPHSFELLERVGFAEMELPSLRYVTQAGGPLGPEKVRRYGTIAREGGWRFFVMYGQTEATARIAYVPPERLLEHVGSVGVPIPGGTLRLVGEDGRDVEAPGVTGELVYRGPNVMMGYALGAEDLARGHELEELRTGDLATRDEDGFYTIVGRKSRFIKPFGLRINLDDVERVLQADGVEAIVCGDDRRLVLALLDEGQRARALRLAQERFALPPGAVEVLVLDQLPLLSSGKYDRARLMQLAEQQRIAAGARDRLPPLGQAFGEILGVAGVSPADSFTSLGGDSLAFVEASLEVERRLGHLPPGWYDLSISALETTPARVGRNPTIEAPVLVRALAIVAVVAGHAGLFSLPGGAYMLLALAGFNFARFQLKRVMDRDTAWPVLGGLSKVIVPTVLLLAVHQAAHRELYPSILLLHGNLVSPELDDRTSYWFIEVMVQVFLIVFGLLSVAAIRRLTRRRPFTVALGLLAASTASAAFVPRVWSTEHLYNRVPHMLLWQVALGMCLQLADDRRRRAVASALAIGLPIALLGPGESAAWIALGGVTLAWSPHLRAPAPLVRAIGWLASGSFYIYLTHYNFFRLASRALGRASPAVGVLVALAGGVVAWAVAERLWKLLPATAARSAVEFDAG